MTTIILIRHGETQWNREETFRGQADVPLNEKGLQQAESVAQATKQWKLAAVYSSPLSRAIETAKAVARLHGLEVQVEPRFIDLNYGEWEGLTVQQVEARYPDLYAQWQKHPEQVSAPKGEGLAQVRARAVPALEVIVSQHPDQTVAVVAHRVVNKVLLCAILGLDDSHFWQIRQDTCALNIFHATPDGYVLRLLNDQCHLRQGGLEPDRVDF